MNLKFLIKTFGVVCSRQKYSILNKLANNLNRRGSPVVMTVVLGVESRQKLEQFC